jgi:hypothetical protein
MIRMWPTSFVLVGCHLDDVAGAQVSGRGDWCPPAATDRLVSLLVIELVWGDVKPVMPASVSAASAAISAR